MCKSVVKIWKYTLEFHNKGMYLLDDHTAYVVQ